ncbi:MAG: glycosyl hydrolase family 28 protein [Bacteroidales bacterium]|nr:glycosyl hydrolase family 28 protein [Bacteroidales bacterium]
MKKLFHSQLVIYVLISLIASHSCNNTSDAESEVIIYPAPEEEILSEDYTIEVNGKPVDIYLAKIAEVEDLQDWMLQPEDVGGPYSFSYFDFSGEVTVKITSLKKPLDQLVIRPLSSELNPVVDGNTVTFTINKPCKLSIEPDGRIEPLLLFANPPEINPPDKEDDNVIYFGPGIHKPEKIELSSGQTLYIAGGAIVKGGVAVSGENIKIMGRGILCGNDWQWRKGPGRMIGMNEARNVVVDGIILRGSWSWTIPIYNSDSVSINNIKLVCSKNPNDDGINPCNSQRIYIRDCFIRTDDDCIAMKGIRLGSENDNVEDIVVENCLLWADRARVFLLGHESRAKYMRNIVLRDLDILHFNMTPFLFEPGEEMSIENVIVENVTAYADYPEQGGAREFNLISLRPVVNQYMHNKVPGKISNLEFRNISLTGEEREGKYPVLVAGADPEHQVTDVTFDNVTWFGHLLDEDSPQVSIEDHTENIRFIHSADR